MEKGVVLGGIELFALPLPCYIVELHMPPDPMAKNLFLQL